MSGVARSSLTRNTGLAFCGRMAPMDETNYIPGESAGTYLCECGYPEGTFACKIRHVHLNTGWAKAAND